MSVLSVSFSIVPDARCAGLTDKQEGLNAIASITGLDLSKYKIVSEENNVTLEQLGGCQMVGVLYNLTAPGSSLRIIYSAVQGNLQGIYVLENTGTPYLVNSLSTSSAAGTQRILSNYQTYSQKQVYGDFATSLNYIDSTKNSTTVLDGKTLQVTAYNESLVLYKWSFSSREVTTSPKDISVAYKNGFLGYLIDNWNIYSVGSTTVNLSKEDAIAIALNLAKTHSYSVEVDKSSLSTDKLNEKSVSKTQLYFDSSVGAQNVRGDDTLSLFPVWTVLINFDKMYGQIFGLQIDIWADTKEIKNIKEQYSTITPLYYERIMAMANETQSTSSVSSATDSSITSWILLSAGIVGATSIVTIAYRSKTSTFKLGKPRFTKTFAFLFCILMISAFICPLIQAASANRGSVIWGARSTDATDYPNWSWRKSDPEISRASTLSTYIHNNFLTAANGYTDSLSYGIDKVDILSQATTLHNTYTYVTVVDWDHGVMGMPGQVGYANVPWNEPHFMFEDDSGTIWGTAQQYYLNPPYSQDAHTDFSHGVYDIDIYNKFAPGEVNFAFINTCMSANTWNYGNRFTTSGNPISLPFAFTHREVADTFSGSQMSMNAYSNPDSFPQCYIGFGSAALDQRMPNPFDQNDPYWYVWVTFFFYWAYNFDLSIHDALDLASTYTWPGRVSSFGTSWLYANGGFSSLWPLDKNGNGQIDPGYPEEIAYSGCYLKVYGNANIHLRNFQASDYITAPSIYGPNVGTTGQSSTFTALSVDSQLHPVTYTFAWGDGTYSTVSSSDIASASHTWTSPGQYSVRVSSQCSNGLSGGWSSYITIAVSMHQLNVDAFSNSMGSALYGIPVYVNGNYYGSTSYSTYLTQGTYQVSVDPTYGWLSVEGMYVDGTYYPGTYSVSVSMSSDHTINAIYS